MSFSTIKSTANQKSTFGRVEVAKDIHNCQDAINNEVISLVNEQNLPTSTRQHCQLFRKICSNNSRGFDEDYNTIIHGLCGYLWLFLLPRTIAAEKAWKIAAQRCRRHCGTFTKLANQLAVGTRFWYHVYDLHWRFRKTSHNGWRGFEEAEFHEGNNNLVII